MKQFLEHDQETEQPDIPEGTPADELEDYFEQWVKDYYDDMNRFQMIELHQASLYLKYKKLQTVCEYVAASKKISLIKAKRGTTKEGGKEYA